MPDLTDVEETYRRQYREALVTLGREPTTHDEVYWTIGDTYRRGVEEWRLRDRAERAAEEQRELSTGFSEDPRVLARISGAADLCEMCGDQLSPPVRENGKLKGRPPKRCERCRGKREGVTGQVELRECEECGKMWERERKRGRPFRTCPGCRGE